MVSVIIPALNEEKTIYDVVASVVGCASVGEILVVDDGSTDRTGERARGAGARVITLPQNVGKGGALHAGVIAAHNDLILFLDADNIGLTHEMLERLIRPVADGLVDMYVGVHARKTPGLDSLHRFLPILSGKRALRKDLWFSVPDMYKERFQIEIALNYFAKKTGKGMGFEVMRGIICIPKEAKYGFLKGFRQRLSMMYDCVSIGFRLYVLHNLRSLFPSSHTASS